MNEYQFCACEEETSKQSTNLPNHFSSNSSAHCDLFEAQFYKEHWHEIQEAENTIFNSTLEQLVDSLRP